VKPTGLDDTDFRILDILVRNGRASYKAIGDAVGLSPHGAADRVRRLVERGAIHAFTAIVHPEAIGRPLDAVIDVRLSSSTAPEDFERDVASLEPVREVAFMTGRYDYSVRVACRDAVELDGTVRALRRHAGTMLTETRIVLHRIERRRGGRDSRLPRSSL
jgi:Lrp/AsnC family leucine-responsive transcriptional regulator